MNQILTTALAVWGAAFGTLSLSWNVWTWRRGRPRLAVIVELREVPDGEEIVYEVRNRGGQPTTVEEICLVKYQDGPLGWFGMLEHVEYLAAKYPTTVQLPLKSGVF